MNPLARAYYFSLRFLEIAVRSSFLLLKRTFINAHGTAEPLTNPIRLRLLCEQSGGAFIKFGQILSLRNDMLPLEYTEEMLSIVHNVPEAPFVEIERVFIEEMGKPPELYFKTFDTTPVSSASIAQVYAATLDTGERVAVKIKRPNTDIVFERDFVVFSFLIDMLGLFNIGKEYRLEEIVLEIVAWTRRELDFRHELKNAQTLFEHSSKHPDTVVPKTYPKMSTSRVLVTEYLDSDSLAVDVILKRLSEDPSFETILNREYGITIDRMSIYLVTDMMRQIFIDGFFHADPHPANIYFLKNNKLGYIDFGIIGEASERRLFLLRFMYGIARQNFKQAAQGFIGYAHNIFEYEIELFKQTKNDVSKKHKLSIEKIESIIESQFEEDLQSLFVPWHQAVSKTYSTSRERTASLKEKSIARVLSRIPSILQKYGLYAPKEVILFFRTMAIVDMVANLLSPQFSLINALNRFFEETPLSRVEEIILTESHKKDLAENIEPERTENFEQLIEMRVIEREKLNIAKERLAEIIAFYAERHEEVRKILK